VLCSQHPQALEIATHRGILLLDDCADHCRRCPRNTVLHLDDGVVYPLIHEREPKSPPAPPICGGLMSGGIATFYALSAANGKERKLALIVSGLVIALGLFRGARVLLHREKT